MWKQSIMAEFTNNQTARRTNKGSRKLHRIIRVDLTPMVDLGFLLITFFVLTTTLSSAKVLPFNVPDDSNGPDNPVAESATVSFIPDENNRLFVYTGKPSQDSIYEIPFSASAIREILEQRRAALRRSNRHLSQLTMIVKPTDGASFKQFVDLADEAQIGLVTAFFTGEPDSLELHWIDRLKQEHP